MSNNPFGDPYSTSHATAHTSAPHPSATAGVRKLKGSTKTFAIILLILGIWNSMSALSAPIFAAIGKLFISIAAEGSKDDRASEQLSRAAQQLDNVFSPLILTFLAITFLLGLGMIFGGIGTLRRQLRGARILRWCAGLMAIFSFIQSGYQIVMMAANRDAMMQDFEDQMNRGGGNQAPPGMENVAQMIFIFQIIFAVLFALAFILVYVWSFLHFSKEETLAQFEPVAEGGDGIR